MDTSDEVSWLAIFHAWKLAFSPSLISRLLHLVRSYVDVDDAHDCFFKVDSDFLATKERVITA